MKNTLTQKTVLAATLFLCIAIGMGLLTSTTLLASIDQPREVIRDGSIIRAYQDDTSYIVKIVGNKLFKRPILTNDMVRAYPHLANAKVFIVHKETLDTFKTSTLIMEVNADGTPTTGKVYYLSVHPEHGTVQKHHLNITAQQFEQIGFDWDSIYHVNHTEASLGFYTKGPDVTAGDLGITPQPSSTPGNDRPYVDVPVGPTGSVGPTVPTRNTVPYIDVPAPQINTGIQDLPPAPVTTPVNTEEDRPTQIATPPRPATKVDKDGLITRAPRTTIVQRDAVYYTSSHPKAVYYYPEDCNVRNTIPARYEQRFSSLSQLFEKYSRTLYPGCI